MEKPLPNQVENYPREGKLIHLFRKILTQSDMVSDLMLIGGTSEYLRSTLPQSVFDKIGDDEGPFVMLYAPKYNDLVAIKRGLPEHIPGYFRLCKNGWVTVAECNEFRAGDIIDCWGVYLPSPIKDRPEIGRLSLVMQKFVQEPKRQGGAEPSSSK